MITEQLAALADNTPLSPTVRLLRFEADTSEISAPGQFVMLSLPGRFLRRPFSVCDWDDGWFSVLVERVGAGTEELHRLRPGTRLPALLGLGHGFETCSLSPLLIGGGTGLSPLVGLARRLRASGVKPRVLLGFKNPAEAFGTELFPECEVTVTDDLFAALPESGCLYACGSKTLMTELARRTRVPSQLAFDVRMGCGIGACMGCAIETAGGMKRVCHDGPVFRGEELR